MFLLLISIRSLFRRNNKIVSLIDHLIHFYVKNSIVSIHYAEWFNLCLHDKVCSCGTSWFLQFYFLRDVHSQFCAFKFCCNKRGRNDYIFCNDIVALPWMIYPCTSNTRAWQIFLGNNKSCDGNSFTRLRKIISFI